MEGFRRRVKEGVLDGNLEGCPTNAKRAKFFAIESWLSVSEEFWLGTYVVVVLLLVGVMAPISWTGNEVNYFDLSLHAVHPGAYGPEYAAYDASNARLLSFGILGLVIDRIGYEEAHVVSRLVLLVVLGGAVAYMARALGFSRAETVAALVAFLLLDQTLMGREWIFGGIEAKTFAYAAVLPAIACAWNGRRFFAVGLAALATYFHFLVGGFWGGAIIVMMFIRDPSLRRLIAPFLLFSVLVLPMFLILLAEQMSVSGEGYGDLGLTANQIYSQFRNPNHVAPFVSFNGFLKRWLFGALSTVVLTGVMAFLIKRGYLARSPFVVWVFGLNGYLVAALIVSFVDRHSSLLGPFYLFRPASLILLLTLMLTFRWLRQTAEENGLREGFARATMILSLVYGVAAIGSNAYEAIAAPRVPLSRVLGSDGNELAAWIRSNTKVDDVMLLGPWTKEMRDFDHLDWVAFEHFFERPTLVSHKFVPTHKNGILRWYHLLRWRDAVFEGRCELLSQQKIDYLVLLDQKAQDRVALCGTPVWNNRRYTVIRVTASARGEGQGG